MELLNKVYRKAKQITAGGSPFRKLRKAYLYSTHPFSYIKRASASAHLSLTAELRTPFNEFVRDGFTLADQIADPELLKSLKAEVARFKTLKKESASFANRSYVRQIIGPDDLLDRENPLVKFALQDNFLKIATAYFKQVPYLCNIQVIESHATGAAELAESQLWHKDYDDQRMFKIFAYLTDVNTPDDGPLTFIPAGPSKKIKDGFFPKRLTDENVKRQGQLEYAREVYGKAGTTFFIDVASCFHQGSRCKNIRLAYIATFTTFANHWPYENKIVRRGQKIGPWDHLLFSQY